MRGKVAQFDEAKGYGTITADDGRPFFFHCTQITDGTRTIPEGAEVDFEIMAGRNGRWEATSIAPAQPSVASPS